MSTLRYVGRSFEDDHVLDRNTMVDEMDIPITKDGLETIVRAGVQSEFLGREDFEAKKVSVVSNATLSAERSKFIATSERGVPNGYAPLDGNGRVRATDTYLEDLGRPWVKLRDFTINSYPLGNHNGVRLSGFILPSPGFPFIPVCFGAFEMFGSGEIYVLDLNMGETIARAWHSDWSGRSGVMMVPAMPQRVSGQMRLDVRIRKIQGESGDYDKPVGTGGGRISIFAIPA